MIRYPIRSKQTGKVNEILNQLRHLRFDKITTLLFRWMNLHTKGRTATIKQFTNWTVKCRHQNSYETLKYFFLQFRQWLLYRGEQELVSFQLLVYSLWMRRFVSHFHCNPLKVTWKESPNLDLFTPFPYIFLLHNFQRNDANNNQFHSISSRCHLGGHSSN